MEIKIINNQKHIPIKIKQREDQAVKILNGLGCDNAELSIVLVDDDEISRLNLAYLDRKGPTNVMSFPMNEGPFNELNPEMLGDVVISVETAARDAEKGGYTLDEMLDFYLVHGILHLLGYGHEDSADRAAEMDARSRNIWNMLGH
ncbi:MAG: rRNA maturation RNase YbeY [Deltaproteobacteria bacterium]|nr:rRNA maturation RNase YbeY [Deltaproteobacteria bacterium]